MIPFSSTIKFNCMIRDMNPAVPVANNTEDNMTLFLKGAPEKVLKRVGKIMVKKEVEGKVQLVEEDYDEIEAFQANAANDFFGLQGERVLAFASTKLNPQKYKKNGEYPFDTKGWASWEQTYKVDRPTNP